MGFKDFFVKEIQDEKNVNYEVNDEEPIEDVVFDDVNTDTLIEDVYTQNDLLDRSKSIFKVEELINSLPKEMPTATKKTSVLAILGSFGLTATEVSIDGERRIEVLNGVLGKISSDCESEIASKEAEIEMRKEEIARLEKEITGCRGEMKFSNEAINAEVARITELNKFIGGTE